MSIVVQKRPYNRNWSGNPIAYQLYSAAAEADESIYFEVRLMFKYIGSDYQEIVKLPYNPVAGVAIVKLQDIIHSLLEYAIPDIVTDEKIATPTQRQTGYFFISYREIDGTETTFDESEIDFARFVIKGGLSYMRWRGDNYWDNIYDPAKPFLTWMKSGRMVAYNERLYLLFLHYTNDVVTDIDVELKYWLIDGTTGTTSAALTASSVPFGSLFYVPAGATQWNISGLAPSGPALHKWRIQIKNGSGTALSEEYFFYQDNRKDYNDTVLHYRSSLGALESARIRGVIETSVDYEGELISKITAPNYFNGDQIGRAMETINAGERIVYRGDIGFLPKDEQDRFRDAHVQRDLWQEKDGKWWPLLNVTPNIKMRKSDDKKWMMPFEWMLGAPVDPFYTPDAAGTGDGEEKTNVCAGTVTGVAVTFPDDPDLSKIEFDATITGATQFTYQVLGHHANPITEAAANLPIQVAGLNTPQNFVLELRALCSNGALGKPVRTPFETGGATYDSAIYNYTDHYEILDVYVDGSVIHSTNLDVGQYDFFNCGTTGVKDIKVGWTNGSVSVAKLICAAGTYFGVISGVEATWDDINITGGFTIELY